MTNCIITVGKLHVKQKNNIILSYLPLTTHNSRFTPC